MPTSLKSLELFTIVMPSGLLTPTRALQGMLHPQIFQSTIPKGLEGLEMVCMMWVDDLIISGSSQGEFCRT